MAKLVCSELALSEHCESDEPFLLPFGLFPNVLTLMVPVRFRASIDSS